MTHSQEISKRPVAAKPANFNTEAANTDVTITLGPGKGEHQFAMIYWSYSATPTNGRLTVMGGGFNFDVDITAGGVGYIHWPVPEYAANGQQIVVTLAAGGAGVVGKLNLLGHKVL
jgi:hypothetical protein